MIPFTIINKKEQAINLRLKKFKPKKFLKPKGKSNESNLENYFCHFCNTQTHIKTHDHSMYT